MRSGMNQRGMYFYESFPWISHSASLEILGHLRPKLRKREKRRGMNVFPRRLLEWVAACRKLEFWVTIQWAHPPADQGNPLKVAEKQEEEERYNRGRWRGFKLIAVNYWPLSLSLVSFSFSSSPPLLFSKEREQCWLLGPGAPYLAHPRHTEHLNSQQGNKYLIHRYFMMFLSLFILFTTLVQVEV